MIKKPIMTESEFDTLFESMCNEIDRQKKSDSVTIGGKDYTIMEDRFTWVDYDVTRKYLRKLAGLKPERLGKAKQY